MALLLNIRNDISIIKTTATNIDIIIFLYFTLGLSDDSLMRRN